ncbi:phage tail protein [Limnobaculum xujianqingii]|uniref:phage tail protein n=1 Tax=Limnobaculum xujianqingii TaxID=2738837 RepID=UPI00112EF983|nr:phage tail protein [Limnobaculum xujianqingii]
MNELPRIKLPVWMNKGEPLKLANAAFQFWNKARDWLNWPLLQIDPETCHESLLSILAYERDINRFAGEPLALFRRRVKYAFINAQDSGSIAGFAAIFRRLGIGEITQLERQPAYDWDVIIIRVTDSQVAENNALMMSLIRQYGRTCRRYIFEVINNKTMAIHGGYFCGSTEFYHATFNTIPGLMRAVQQAKSRVIFQGSQCYTASLKEVK